MRNNLSSPYLIEHATPRERARTEAGELRGKNFDMHSRGDEHI